MNIWGNVRIAATALLMSTTWLWSGAPISAAGETGCRYIAKAVVTPTAPAGTLFSLSAVSRTNIWALGTNGRDNFQSLIEHYDGRRWTTMQHSPGGVALRSITASASRMVWVFGENENYGGYNNEYDADSAFIESYDGKKWSIDEGAFPAYDQSGLFAATRIRANDQWAVGSAPNAALIQHFNGKFWQTVSGHGAFKPAKTLFSVSASSARNVWSVGTSCWQNMYNGFGGYENCGKERAPAILHFDGAKWSSDAVPSSVAAGSELGAVDALSSRDVWAGGISGSGGSLVLHFDGSAWSVMPAMSPISKYNYVCSISAVSAGRVWVVLAPAYSHDACLQPGTALEYFDGSAWTRVSAVDANVPNETLNSVTAIDSKHVWAAGTDTAYGTTVTQEFDGANWTRVASSNAQVGAGGLRSVSALSASDVWAVGHTNFAPALTEHYNGSQWSIVGSPGFGRLFAVAALSTDDVWATGQNAGYLPLIEHYDGLRWSRARGAYTAAVAYLSSVAAISPSNIWAVGAANIDGPANSFQPLIEHFDGRHWTVSKAGQGPDGKGKLSGIVALSASDMWAVGNDEAHHTLVEHFDGSTWSLVPSPNSTLGGGSLNSITGQAHDDLWAVGSYDYGQRSLVEHYNGSMWSVVRDVPLHGGLHGITELTPNNIWAFGGHDNHSYDPLFEQRYPVVEHFHYGVWTNFTPYVHYGAAVTWAGDATTPNLMWAVGNDGGGTPVIAQYVGTGCT